MVRLAGFIALLAFLASCATNVTDRENRAAQDEAIAEELENCSQTISELEAQLANSQRRLEESEAELAAARRDIDRLQEEIRQLQDTLNQQVRPSDPELQQLREELETARQAERQAVANAESEFANSQSLSSELNDLRSDYEVLSEQFDNARAQAGTDTADPRIFANAAEAIELDADSPVIQTVYYATNRIRLERSWYDAIKPYFLPFVVLVVAWLTRKAVARYIKEQYQVRSRAAVLVIGALLFIGTLGLAVQGSLLAAQRAEDLSVQYGNELRKPVDGELPYERGSVDVSVPPKRKIGEISRPDLIRFEFVIDPTRHFQLASINPSTSDEFYEALNETIADDPSASAFVFVHGYYNTFEDAAFRTAQMALDMGFKGAPLFFSWPSQGAVMDYFTDAKNVETSVEHLRLFLEELHAESGASRIHLIAHSMGSRALAQAIENMGLTQTDTRKFGQLVFAAPDIAKDLLEQKVELLDQATQGVTLYASAHDSALKLSRALQGREAEDYQRAGETYPSPMVAPPMQTIDVSRATNGHSYVSDSPSMMNELSGLFNGSRVLAPSDDNFVPVSESGGYWILRDRD